MGKEKCAPRLALEPRGRPLEETCRGLRGSTTTAGTRQLQTPSLPRPITYAGKPAALIVCSQGRCRAVPSVRGCHGRIPNRARCTVVYAV